MIQRYTARDDYENHGPYEDDGGEWVKWEDISSMLDKLERLANSPYLASDDNGCEIAKIIGREWNP